MGIAIACLFLELRAPLAIYEVTPLILVFLHTPINAAAYSLVRMQLIHVDIAARRIREGVISFCACEVFWLVSAEYRLLYTAL